MNKSLAKRPYHCPLPRLVVALLPALIALAALLAAPAPALAADSGGDQPMYRLYNTTTREHFYTASATERDTLKSRGWNDEGIGWYAPKKSSTPVYRLYNPSLKDHHYTTSKKEHDALVKGGSWKSEGIGFYSCDEKEVALYREFHPSLKSGAHNYTTDSNEHKVLTTKRGWRDEGIGWYGCMPGSSTNWSAVRFDKNGGDGTMHVQVFSRSKAATLDTNAFKRSGYSFVGWNTKADGSGTSYKDKASVKDLAANRKTITLYAQWKKTAASTYKIAFSSNGGTGSMKASTLARGKASTLPANAYKRSNFTFAGWNTKANGSGTSYKDKASVKDLAAVGKTVTLYAQWKPIVYTVHFDDNGATENLGKMADQTISRGTSTALRANVFRRTGFGFSGWNDKADGTGKSYKDKASVKDLASANGTITLYAQWSEGSYSIIFDGNGSEKIPVRNTMQSQIAGMDEEVTLTKNRFTRELMEFTGWNTKKDGTGKSYKDMADVKNLAANGKTITLYAQWKDVAFIIHYDGNFEQLKKVAAGRPGMPNGPSLYRGPSYDGRYNYNSGDQWTAPRNYSGNYYGGVPFYEGTLSFAVQSWNTKADGTGKSYTVTKKYDYKDLAKGSGTITLYAQWVPNYIYVNIMPNFSGYSAAKHGSWPQLKIDFTTDVNRRPRSASFNTSDVKNLLTFKVTTFDNKTETVTTSAVLKGFSDAKNGKGKHWYSSGNISWIDLPEMYPGAVNTIYAQWDTNVMNIRFYNDMSGTSYTDKTFVVGQEGLGQSFAVSGKNAPSGYSCVGWTTGKTFTSSSKVITSPAAITRTAKALSSKTLYAVWRQDYYPVKFDANGGYLYYRFSGTAQRYQVKTANMSTYPSFSSDTVRITFESSKESAPLRTGYVFSSWNTKADGSGKKIDNYQTVTHADLGMKADTNYYVATTAAAKAAAATSPGPTLYAQWKPNTITVNYYSNGATSNTKPNPATTPATKLRTTTYSYDGTSLAANGLPNADGGTWKLIKPGYHAGSDWLVGSATSTTKVSANTKFATVQAFASAVGKSIDSENQTVNLYAAWEPNTYTVKFNANGGSGTMANQTLTYAANQALNKNTFTRSGYTFAGWAKTQARANAGTVDYANQLKKVHNLTTTNGATVNLYAVWKKTSSAPAQPSLAAPQVDAIETPAAPIPSVETPVTPEQPVVDPELPTTVEPTTEPTEPAVEPKQEVTEPEQPAADPEQTAEPALAPAATESDQAVSVLLHLEPDAEPMVLFLEPDGTLILPDAPPREGLVFAGWCTRAAGLPEDLSAEQLAAALSDAGLVLEGEEAPLRLVAADAVRVDATTLPLTDGHIVLHALWEAAE